MIVKIHEDITTYENKVAGNFTMRQIKGGLLAFIIIAGSFWGLPYLGVSGEISQLISVFLGLPVFVCTFWKMKGMYCDTIIIQKLKEMKYYRPRPFHMQNLYEDIENFIREEEKVDEKERKQLAAIEEKEHKATRHKSAVGKQKHRTNERAIRKDERKWNSMLRK